MTINPFERPRTSDGSIPGSRSIPAAHRLPPRNRSRLALALALGVMPIVAACAPSRPIPPSGPPTTESISASEFDEDQRARLDRLDKALDAPVPQALLGGVVVRLAFDDAADLDLFVTDPAQESVYFANSPTRSGGHLIDDRRCHDPSPRVERVKYENPIAGRYRVGVDFHGLCPDSALSGDQEKQGLYVVRIDVGGRVMKREGMVTPGVFEVIVIEFDVEEAMKSTDD